VLREHDEHDADGNADDDGMWRHDDDVHADEDLGLSAQA
jgi:hypothetical protein